MSVSFAYPVPPRECSAALTVGGAIQDLSMEAETPMKRFHYERVRELQEEFPKLEAGAREKYDRDCQQFQTEKKAAEKISKRASLIIDGARWQKAVAITVFAAAIICGASVIVAGAFLKIGLSLFFAAPFFIGAAPAGYYSHVLGNKVDQLEKDIARPKNMKAPQLALPILRLPVYNPSQDLDLANSRMMAQNSVASCSTLEQLSHVKYSDEQLVSYALLDKITPAAPEKRGHFYAWCIQLMTASRRVESVNEGHEEWITRKFYNKESEISGRESRRNEELRNELSKLNIDKIRFRYRPAIEQTHFEKESLATREKAYERSRLEAADSFRRERESNRIWFDTMLANNNSAYKIAQMELEAQFQQAKRDAMPSFFSV